LPDKLYRRTAAGKLAWQRQDAGVPVDYRRILGVVGEAPMHLDTLRTRLARYSESDLEHLLDELADLGLVEASAAKGHHDLDFTGDFTVNDLKKRK
jgi:hypothetical protein